MAMTVRIELHNAGFNQLRTSPGVVADINRRASRIAGAAGEGMVVQPSRGSGARARASVKTETLAAKRAESERKALTRAIGAGR